MKSKLFTMSAIALLGFGLFTQSASALEHKVESGDTLYTISEKYGVSVDDIMKVNNLESDMLNIDVVLNIPTDGMTSSQLDELGIPQGTEDRGESGIVDYVDLQGGASLPEYLMGKWKTSDNENKIEIKQGNYLVEEDKEYHLVGYENVSEYVYVFNWDEDLFMEEFLTTPESRKDFNPQPIYIDFFPGENGDKKLDKLFYNGYEMIRDIDEEDEIVDEEGSVEEVVVEEESVEVTDENNTEEIATSEIIEEAVESVESDEENNTNTESQTQENNKSETSVESKVIEIKQDESSQGQVIVVESTNTTEGVTTENTTVEADDKVVIVDKKEEVLPQTGEMSSVWLYIIGGILLAGAISLMFFGKKDKDKDLGNEDDINENDINDENID